MLIPTICQQRHANGAYRNNDESSDFCAHDPSTPRSGARSAVVCDIDSSQRARDNSSANIACASHLHRTEGNRRQLRRAWKVMPSYRCHGRPATIPCYRPQSHQRINACPYDIRSITVATIIRRQPPPDIQRFHSATPRIFTPIFVADAVDCGPGCQLICLDTVRFTTRTDCGCGPCSTATPRSKQDSHNSSLHVALTRNS